MTRQRPGRNERIRRRSSLRWSVCIEHHSEGLIEVLVTDDDDYAQREVTRQENRGRTVRLFDYGLEVTRA